LEALILVWKRLVWDTPYFIATFEPRRVRTGVLGEAGKTSHTREGGRIHEVI